MRGQCIGVGGEGFSEAEEGFGNVPYGLGVLPREAVLVVGVEPQDGLEGTELDPAVVEVGRVGARLGRWRAQEAPDVAAHVRLSDGRLGGSQLGLLGQGVPGAPGVTGEGDGRGVVGPGSGWEHLLGVLLEPPMRASTKPRCPWSAISCA